MKELIPHIKDLLQEHECVIIPGFGGFITYYAPARHDAKTHAFLPPYKTLGFNPLLQINDGLLAQSYMQRHDIGYPAAMRMVESATDRLREELSASGSVQFPGLGVLTMNIEGNIVFQPEAEGIGSPSLYGFSAFEMKSLKQLASDREKGGKKSVAMHDAGKKGKRTTLVISINRTWLSNAVAAVAAVLLFFVLSVPVDNTYVEPESYALWGNGRFEQIKAQSLATVLLSANRPADPDRQGGHSRRAESARGKETAEIREDKTRPADTQDGMREPARQNTASSTGKELPAVTPVRETNGEGSGSASLPGPASRQADEKGTAGRHDAPQYHIIVASTGSRQGAEAFVRQLADKGYSGAAIIERDGKIRVAIMSGSDKESLSDKLAGLRKNEMFENAWMLTTRPIDK